MRSRQRVIDHGEVFTPPKLVADMCDLVAHECERIDSRFLEPACGDGAFLSEVLTRKLRTVHKKHPKNALRWQRDAFIAVASLYGIDLLPDNVVACRHRLLTMVADAYRARFKTDLPDDARNAYAYVVSVNILQGDALTLLDAANQPIVFPEWSAINGTRVKRRDFKFEHLLGHAQMASAPLFSDLGKDVFLPRAVRDYPVCDFLKVNEQGDARE